MTYSRMGVRAPRSSRHCREGAQTPRAGEGPVREAAPHGKSGPTHA